MTQTAQIQSIIDRFVHSDQRGALLPLLHEIQEELGFIAPGAVPLIADALLISRAEVHGVISFYPDFRTEPPARHVIKLCRAESCQARGGAAIEAELSHHLGVAMGHARKDGQVALEPVYCLGLCAIGPNAMVDDRPVARIDSAAIGRIAGEVEA
ncbi:formate dehydrogenase subunit gamma [Novosphingobium mangrovi (ex Huang et al. 2023)]|uniref:Formate dehydrogenase subunit gamma n=1 Tax=Novosphingobium mangrovi (ex Huang et al. 2023) TaxID=2976432 RepID=A0ABT2HZV9_9SPHN|nr:formate dehydrogenase subunit gamma [Novosphingobium mangrovi (ex Huang et al. 2023)]MCT2398085.1 formate dehydrogenase subunit gamma [Novosphingobium mangrovi (ex Huang et al. 2023)]